MELFFGVGYAQRRMDEQEQLSSTSLIIAPLGLHENDDAGDLILYVRLQPDPRTQGGTSPYVQKAYAIASVIALGLQMHVH